MNLFQAAKSLLLRLVILIIETIKFEINNHSWLLKREN
ncbi:MAG: hypothetical protein MRERV_21c041 [Mycoplasmataceae bacterium RV_VA103A]|nr:MAG: hypothetical protein MRERV_21c041 [Mycoplasmataceae bacterium RV_VA103A]